MPWLSQAQPDTIIRALQIGSRAALRFSGHVHSVYRQACNIETDYGTLVTLLSQGLGNLPHGIRCVLPAPADFRTRCMAGQTVVADGVDLRIVQAGMTVHLSGAATWRCVPAACVVDPCAGQTLRALLEVRSTLRKQAPASGFAPLLLCDDEPDSALDRALQRRLRGTLPILGEATCESGFGWRGAGAGAACRSRPRAHAVWRRLHRRLPRCPVEPLLMPARAAILPGRSWRSAAAVRSAQQSDQPSVSARRAGGRILRITDRSGVGARCGRCGTRADRRSPCRSHRPQLRCGRAGRTAVRPATFAPDRAGFCGRRQAGAPARSHPAAVSAQR